MLPELISTPELAEYLEVPERTLDQWAYQGKGPAYARVGRYRRYRVEDVKAWLESQTAARAVV